MHRLRPDVQWRVVDGEVVALDVPQSRYVATNRSGAPLWRLIGEGATTADLVSVLVESYGLGPEAATADVERFLEELRDRDLLQP